MPKTPGASSPMPDAFESGVTNFAGTRRTPTPANRFAPGSIIAGRYRLVALLGKGGMGEVYRAEDLRAWDFVHCPPGTEHVFVGAGDGPCVIFMSGRRTLDKGIVYPRSELARRHGAGVETETSSAAEAYATFPHWQPERPERWNELPWVK